MKCRQRYFHGSEKKYPFFEGWYFKHQSKQGIIAFIPAFHVNPRGRWSASIQVITNQQAYYIEYPIQTCKIGCETLYIKIGKNIFSEKGIYIDIQEKDIQIRGNISYTPFTALRFDIMGPFRYLPFMQCNHGVLSLTHQLKGILVMNGKQMQLSKGTGYIEKDWGYSFPKAYRWTQCNFIQGGNNCIMLSIATIPLWKIKFTGCICVIYYRGIEYRMATYQGVQIIKSSPREIIIQQRNLRLQVTKLEEGAQKLRAPQHGCMKRIIYENPACRVRYQFWENHRLLFNIVSDNAGFEQAGNCLISNKKYSNVLTK
ncbi:MAG: tocopherol cyclase family protein [Lachnospiraceae bacterium]